jgi:hypothetical protein
VLAELEPNVKELSNLPPKEGEARLAQLRENLLLLTQVSNY